MTRYRNGLAAVLALAIGAATQPVQAATPTPEATSAARVRELQMMLSSASLRCKMIGISLESDYESFSAGQAPALTRAEQALKQHFEVRTKADLRSDYDRYHVRLLNFYGTGRTDQQSCQQFGNLMSTLAKADQEGVLLGKIAEIMVAKPMIENVSQ